MRVLVGDAPATYGRIPPPDARRPSIAPHRPPRGEPGNRRQRMFSPGRSAPGQAQTRPRFASRRASGLHPRDRLHHQAEGLAEVRAGLMAFRRRSRRPRRACEAAAPGTREGIATSSVTLHTRRSGCPLRGGHTPTLAIVFTCGSRRRRVLPIQPATSQPPSDNSALVPRFCASCCPNRVASTSRMRRRLSLFAVRQHPIRRC